MEKTIVFIINNKNNYLKMAKNSIKMLRKHNKNIKILCLSTDIFAGLENLDVKIIKIKNLDNNYFLLNKIYLSEIESRSVLYIDSDTFIFDDVDKIFHQYCEKDFYACENKWSYKLNFDLFKPFNGGVLLFNNYCHKKIYEDFSFKLKNIEKLYPDIYQWMKNINNLWVREEFLLSRIIYEDKTSYGFFDKNYVKLIEEKSDIDKFKDTIIFHTFTNNWEIVKNIVNKSNIKLFKYKKQQK